MTARILVVDDIATNVRLLEARLTAEYYDVKSVQNGYEVPALAHLWQPDVILLDVMMPDINGYEICRLLKAARSTSHIPVIMVTALKETADRLQALSCGADEFLTKPIEHEVLLARLRSTIRLKHLLDEWRLRGTTAVGLGIDMEMPAEVALEPGVALVVDDLVSRAARIRDMLSRGNVITVLAQDERAALLAVEGGSFDLIAINLTRIIDDPLRLVAKLRAEAVTRDTPLLLIAEAEQRDLVVSGLNLGANDCIMLPLDESELLLRVRSHIRRKQFQDRLRTDINSALALAVTDPLTGLHNRRYFMTRLERLCTDAGADDFAVLMIDVDHFKLVNDSHGHYTGDRVLQQVAKTLRDNLREDDLVARYGGEEFVVIIRRLHEPLAAVTIAEKLRRAIEHMKTEPRLKVTISVGVAVAGGVESATALIDRADKALYEAKRFGRNQVTLRDDIAPEPPSGPEP